jgi:hypothetical protein
MRLWRSTLLLAAVAGPALVQPRVSPYFRQPELLTVTVVDSMSRRPLPNADIADLVSGQHRITDENGRASLTWPSDGKMRLRVRQVGYQPRQSVLERKATGGVITVAMNKVAYLLSDVRSTGRCATTQVDSSLLDLSVVALDQLKQAAEKYDEFRRTYPFEVTLERRTAAIPERGDVKRILVSKEKFRSENLESKYRPGDIIERSYRDFAAPILLLSNLADSVFWEHHCFLARGFQWYQGDRVVRLEFSPTADIKGPDYKGSALLDSATSMLLRIDFQLANVRPGHRPVQLVGYTTFTSPSPFAVLPDSTVAVWWLKARDNSSWERPDYVQSLHVEEVKYRKQTPPSYGDAR